MRSASIVQRSWFYHFVRILALVELTYYVAVLIDLLLHPTGPDIAGDPAVARIVNALVEAPVILVVGVLVLRHARGNVIGWLLVLWGTQIGAGAVRVEAFGGYAGELSLFSLCLWPVLWAIPIHFPDGEPYPRRLGWVAQGAIAATIVLLLMISYGTPAMDSSFPLRAGTPNRFYVPLLSPAATLVGFASSVPFVVLLGLLVISITLRFRASRGRERQQLKYMLTAAVLIIVLLTAGDWLNTTLANRNATSSGLHTIEVIVANMIFPLLPVAGIALPILRHQLYDIDIIIRRTVTYTLLTVLLLAVYFGGVVVLQQAFVALTGQRSELAIILSTLAIAALFVPLRNRIQHIIDRRFFRSKYNAQQVLESFARTARDEVDAQRQMTQLLDAVEDTLQPESMALWTSFSASATEKRR